MPVNENNATSGTAVTFSSEGGTYGFRIGSINEILGEREVTPVPQVPPYVLGVINLRGEVIPVIDFRKRLGFPEGEPTGKETFIVITSDNITAAVKTDNVETSLNYDSENYLPIEEESIASGMILDGSSRVTLINEQKFLSEP